MESELQAYAAYLNFVLQGNKDVEALLPLDSSSILDKAKDGVLFARTLTQIKDTLPGRLITSDATANHTAVIKGLKEKLRRDVAATPAAAAVGDRNALSELAWEVVRAHIMRNINLIEHTELIRSLKKGQGIDLLINMTPEQLILRWFNYHAVRSGLTLSEEQVAADKQQLVENFGEDLKDCTLLTALLQSVAPTESPQPPVLASVLQTDDLSERAKRLLEAAAQLGCPPLASPEDIVGGITRPVLLLTAQIFNTHIGIKLPSEEEMDLITNEIQDLKRQLLECREMGQGLAERIQIIETEKSVLEAKKQELSDLIDQRSAEIEDKQAEKARREANAGSDIERLNKTIIDRDEQITCKSKELEELAAKKVEFVSTSDSTIAEQLAQIAELEARLAQLQATKGDLQEKVGGKGQELATLSEALLNAEDSSKDKSRLIVEHVEEVYEKINALGGKLSPAAKYDLLATNDETAMLKAAQQAQLDLIEKYKAELNDTEAMFGKQQSDVRNRMEDINKSVADYLGDGQNDAGDAITNMKRLLELMIEKCKKQASQIKTLEHTIEGKDRLNTVMTEKIRVIADENLSKRSKPMFGRKKK